MLNKICALLLVGLATLLMLPVTHSDAGAAKDKDIVETAVAAGKFKTLAAALEAAALVDTLKSEGPFTVFAPTDEAFSSLGSGTVKNLVAAQKYSSMFKTITKDDGHLHAILTYHVVKGKLQEKELLALAKEGKTLDTVNGAQIKLSLDGDRIKVGDAVITKTDVLAKNGIIHVIDGVLLPPAPPLNIEGRKRVPACPPADEPLIWQRTITRASPKSDRELLVKLWKRAAEQTPPIGNKEKWDVRTGELVKLAETYAGEKDQQKAADAASALVQKANCIGCHAEYQKTPFSNPR